MSILPGAPVVVGVDGSAASLTAVELAVRTAVERHRPVRIVHAFLWPLLNVPVAASSYGPPDGGPRTDADRIVRDAQACAHRADARVRVTAAVVIGTAPTVLLHESRQAWAVVLGDRGVDGVTGFLLGSIAGRVSAHARCPVLMARGAPRPDGPVVVGVDGSAHSIGALAFAAEEASLRKTDLVAVHAWTGPVAVEPGDMLPLVFDPAELAAEETRLLAEAVAGLSDDYPDLTITRRVVRGRAAHTLIDHSRIAQLVVVGAKGRGRFAGLPLGSVSQALLRHADCPVAVVR